MDDKRLKPMIDSASYRLSDKCYFQEKQDKDLIVLHFTAGGTAKSAVQWWEKQANKVSTAYLLDLDGTIYEVFDPSCWAYHLGIKGADGKHSNDKRSIGIEICNIGPLKLDGDSLCSWPGNFKNKYCHVSEAHRYTKTPFRGFDYYASFTDQQKVGIGVLVDHLCSRFGIKKVIATEKKDQCDVSFFSNWKGICTHANFRPDKFDISWDVFDKAWLGL